MDSKLEVRVVELAPHDFPPDVEPAAKERFSVYLRIGGKESAYKRCDHKIAERARQLDCPFVMRTGFVSDGLLKEAGYYVDFYKKNPVSEPDISYILV